jgi:hypothetical protein
MKIPALILATLFSLQGFTQSKEYIIKHSGDTVKGDVSLRNKKIYVDNGASVAEFKAADIYKVVGNYKGNIVVPCKLQVYTDDLSSLESEWVKLSAVDTVLLLEEIYTTPKMNLYYCVDKMKVPYYFYKAPADASPVQLVVRYYMGGGLTSYANAPGANRGEKSQTHLEEDKGYVNQLHAIMGDCKKISEGTWEILSYRDYSFKQLIKKYNNCK